MNMKSPIISLNCAWSVWASSVSPMYSSISRSLHSGGSIYTDIRKNEVRQVLVLTGSNLSVKNVFGDEIADGGKA